ncbi:hypothetical protein Ahy_B09g095259 [Arachis hypogaea]|uniref:BED-type domain-containing protein n=1 Tax=Arachis hypogaea TaxID=3818 RepID=A0A444XDH0_ARAHY|nr:hypothetical protein Ahy_B09g095259 [Arachis hypogaea]
MDSFSSTPIENNNEIEPTQDDEGQAIEAHIQGTQEEGQEETQEGGQEVSQEVQNSPNKKELTSEAWKHFRREKIDGKWKAICKYCERKIGGDTKQGTKHLHDHIRICPIRTVRGPKQDGEWGPAENTGNAGNGDGGNYLPTAGIGAGTGTKFEGGDGEQGGIPRPGPAPLTSLSQSNSQAQSKNKAAASATSTSNKQSLSQPSERKRHFFVIQSSAPHVPLQKRKLMAKLPPSQWGKH